MSHPLSRRRFLAGGSAVAGAVLLSGCGDDGDGAVTSSTTAPPSAQLSLVQFFGGLPMLTAGREVRAPFGVADGDGILPVDRTPDRLTVDVLDETGERVAEAVEVRRHAEGLPRAYFPLRFTVEDPGVYTGRVEIDGQAVEMAIKVDAADDVKVVQAGDVLPAIVTPTRADAQGVDPICTNDPICPLHDVTLEEALDEGRPIGLLVATPAFCQVAICGPVLDVLLAVASDHPDVRLVHAEVYADPEKDLRTKTAAVDELALAFEPCLVLADADGVVIERLDTIYDEVEVGEALGRLAG